MLWIRLPQQIYENWRIEISKCVFNYVSDFSKTTVLQKKKLKHMKSRSNERNTMVSSS